MKPIPDNIKQILGQLQGPQQVALKGYIGTLRAEMKDLEAQLHALKNPAPDHGHYHGHELCTADHGHSEHAHGHKKEHEHPPHHKEHDQHEHHHHKEHDHEHDHHKEHHDHQHNDHCEHKDHDHKHHHKEHHDHHEHKHEHHHHDEVPAWKKKAMESDPSAAPFGGSWNAESNVNAKHGKH